MIEISSFYGVLFLIFFVVIHEVGHALMAMVFGKFRGFGITWYGVVTKIALPVRWEKFVLIGMSGFYLSFLVYLLLFGLGVLDNNVLWCWYLIGIACLDFFMVFLIIQEHKANPFFYEVDEKTNFYISFGVKRNA